ncbi:hypothetical protein GUITHDRAFT_165872, partial [Guillardia theta CCMP2712]
MLGAAVLEVAYMQGRRKTYPSLPSLPQSLYAVKLIAPSSWKIASRPLASFSLAWTHSSCKVCRSAPSACRTFMDRRQIRHDETGRSTPLPRHALLHGVSRSLLSRSATQSCLTVGRGLRAMSTPSKDREVMYESRSISTLQNLAMGSVAQTAICCLVGGLLAFHPAAASSAWLPGWTLQGRAFLSGIIVGFGCTITMGARAFVTKQIVRVSSSPHSPDEIEIDVMSFPSGVTVHRLPAKEFYAITAAYGEFDIDKEAAGAAPMLPVYVGGSVKNTLMIDMRGKFLHKDRMQELLVSVPDVDEEMLKNE